ncbi:MAG TPA: DUF5723 family protein [Cyclobacteriaceae bacterium]|nr:DUF5723 family protein [Cyclobacteriaceae bacterium]
MKFARSLKLLGSLAMIVFARPLFSQQEGTMYFMNNLPQVVYSNPAMIPKYKFSLGLPGSSVFVLYSNSGFSYDDVITKKSGTVTADLPKLNSKLENKNYITNAVQADLFRLSFRFSPRMYFTFNVTAKAYNRLLIPKDLTGLIINGTAPFINGTATLSPKIESMGYVESAWGASYAVNKDLVVGARIKYLKGFANVTTESSSLTISLNNDYTITAAAGLDSKSSGVQNFEQNGFDISKSWQDYTNNNGYAFDLGATYRLFDRLTLGASVVDIGRIQWTNNTYGYSLNKSKANYTFQGIDLNKVLQGDHNYIDAQVDTVKNRFTTTEQKIGAYSTPLPGKVYFSGNYEIKRNFTVGALFYAEIFRDRFSPSATASINKHFGRRFSGSLSYTASNNSYNNIGTGLALNGAHFQFYVVGDNILGAPLALASGGNLNPYINNTKLFTLRLGLNIVAQWDSPQERQPYPKKKRKKSITPSTTGTK